MNERRAPVDRTVVHEWYAQMAEAARTPGLAQHLVRRTGELLPRFAAFYDALRALPRRIRRAIARGRGLSLARVALLLALCGAPLRAATIHVDEASCRLADAIVASNTDAAAGGCAAGSGDDLLLLDADVTLGADLPEIALTTTIQAGLASVIDGAGHECIHVGYPFGDVTLDGLTVRGCVRTSGGGVFNEAADLTVASCTITGNRATGGFLDGGGGIQNFYGVLTVTNSTISGNIATTSGGGVLNSGGFMTIDGSTISGNTTGGHGGGIDNYYSAVAYVTNSVISGNAAEHGGGVSAGSDWGGGNFDLRTSTVTGNTATVGAGILSYLYGSIQVVESTVSGNTASSRGGGIGLHPHCFACYVTLVDATVTGNTAGEAGGGIATAQYNLSVLTLSHALISGNGAPRGAEMLLDPTVHTFANDFNLVGFDGDARSVGFTPGASDIVPAPGVLLPDILSPLADNGGATPTHALATGSPAIDAVPAGSCFGAIDQREFPRPVGAGCDVGAVENEARTPFGGAASGFVPRRIRCQDGTTGQAVRGASETPGWSCEVLGLSVQSGHVVSTSASGVAGTSAIGGSVTGVTPTSVACENLSTGQKVQSALSAKTWDCGAMGLSVTPGDRVSTGATGTVE